MKWMNTVGSFLANWSDRKTLSSAFWTWEVPPEVQFALCNKIGADCWFNMPILSTDDYVTQFATLAHSMLNSNLKAYVEYGNEIWNNGAMDPNLWTQLVAFGYAAFPSAGNDFNAAFTYAILRAVQNGATWKNVWGADAGRVVRVAAGQNGYTARNQFILGFTAGSYGGDPSKFSGTAAQNVDVLATSPYFGYPVPNTFTLDQLFAEINSGGVAPNGYPGGMIKQALDYAASDYSVASAAGLPLVAYEGGQTLVDYSHSDLVLQNLYATANRDPRMGAAYTNFFNGWKSLGGTLFVNFTLSGIYSQWGYWSLLENILQTSTAKYDAVVNFIAANPCWWNGCARVGAAGGGSTTTSTGGTATTSGGTTSTGGTTTTSGGTTSTGGTTTTSGGTTSTGGTTTTSGGTTSTGGTTTTSGGTTSTGGTTTTAVGTTSTGGTPTTSSGSGSTTTTSGGTTTTSGGSMPVPPTVAITSPGNGTLYQGNGAVNIAVAASNPTAQIASISISIDNSTISTCANTTACSFSWPGVKVSQGTHTVSAIAVDAAGQSASTSVTITALK